MFDLDIDLEEIEKIKNPMVRNIASQLRMNGFATTLDNTASRIISKKLPEYRKKKGMASSTKILMAPDRKADINIISINPNLSNPSRELERFIKKLITRF